MKLHEQSMYNLQPAQQEYCNNSPLLTLRNVESDNIRNRHDEYGDIDEDVRYRDSEKKLLAVDVARGLDRFVPETSRWDALQ